MKNLTKIFIKSSKDTFKKEMRDWSMYLKTRTKHEDIEDSANRFNKKLLNRQEAIWLELTPILIEGLDSGGGTIRFCPFLKDLCGGLNRALDTYKKSKDCINQYLTQDKTPILASALMSMKEQSHQYREEAVRFDHPALAEILGMKHGYALAFKSIGDIATPAGSVDVGHPNSAVHSALDFSSGEKPPAFAQERRPIVMLTLLLLIHNFGLNLNPRKEDKQRFRKPDFNQRHLAKVLATIRGDTEIRGYTDAIQDVLTVWETKGSKSLLDKSRILHAYIQGHANPDEFTALIESMIDDLPQ